MKFPLVFSILATIPYVLIFLFLGLFSKDTAFALRPVDRIGGYIQTHDFIIKCDDGGVVCDGPVYQRW